MKRKVLKNIKSSSTQTLNAILLSILLFAPSITTHASLKGNLEPQSDVDEDGIVPAEEILTMAKATLKEFQIQFSFGVSPILNLIKEAEDMQIVRPENSSPGVFTPTGFWTITYHLPEGPTAKESPSFLRKLRGRSSPEPKSKPKYFLTLWVIPEKLVAVEVSLEKPIEICDLQDKTFYVSLTSLGHSVFRMIVHSAGSLIRDTHEGAVFPNRRKFLFFTDLKKTWNWKNYELIP